MNYQIVTGSTGTSISISFIEIYGNAIPAAAPTRQTYRHFDNTPKWVLGRQNYNSFGGGQMIIFGDVIKPVELLLSCSKLVRRSSTRVNAASCNPCARAFESRILPLKSTAIG